MVLAGSAPVLVFPWMKWLPGNMEPQYAWESHLPEMLETASTRCDDAKDKKHLGEWKSVETEALCGVQKWQC